MHHDHASLLATPKLSAPTKGPARPRHLVGGGQLLDLGPLQAWTGGRFFIGISWGLLTDVTLDELGIS